MFGIAAASALRHPDKAKRLGFTDRRSDAVAIDAVFDKMLERDRQSAVIIAAVVAQLNLDTGDHHMRGLRERSIRWGFQHSYRACCELLANLVPALRKRAGVVIFAGHSCTRNAAGGFLMIRMSNCPLVQWFARLLAAFFPAWFGKGLVPQWTPAKFEPLQDRKSPGR